MSSDDLEEVRIAARNPLSLPWNALNKDPTKLAVLRAIVLCQIRLGLGNDFRRDIGDALAQKHVCFYLFIFIGHGRSALLNSFQLAVDLGFTLSSLYRRPDFWKSPVGDVPEEN